MADDRKRGGQRDEDAARPQQESSKVHGDKLDPIIPRGADEGGEDSERRPGNRDQGQGTRD